MSPLKSSAGIWAASQLSRFHRVWFVVGTVTLSVAASRVANDTTELGSWLLTLASVLMIASSDVGRDLDQNARRLAASSGRISYDKALADLAESDSPRWLPATVPAVAVLMVSAGVAFSLSAIGLDDPGRNEMPPPSLTPNSSVSPMSR